MLITTMKIRIKTYTSPEYKHMWDFLIQANKSYHNLFNVSNSEIKRWFERNSVQVNGEPVKFDDPVPEEINSLVLFPKSKKRITLL